jgi:hypothetical protein
MKDAPIAVANAVLLTSVIQNRQNKKITATAQKAPTVIIFS